VKNSITALFCGRIGAFLADFSQRVAACQCDPEVNPSLAADRVKVSLPSGWKVIRDRFIGWIAAGE